MEENTKMNKITPSYKIVDGVLVWIRKDITDFVIPDGVVEVADNAIHENIKKIVFPDSVKKFYIPENNSIKEIVLPRIINEFEKREEPVKEHWGTSFFNKYNFGFKNLGKLESVGIPLEHFVYCFYGKFGEEDEYIEKKGKEYDIKCSKVILRYDTFDDLLKYYEEYVDSFFSEDSKKKYIECIGPKLSMKEKSTIKRKFKKYSNGFSISFLAPKDISHEADAITDDNEIQSLVDEIKSICDRLPENTKNMIMEKVNNLLIDYYKELEKYEPKYSKKTSIAELELGDAKTLKPNLLAKLEGIKASLTTEKELIKFLSDIERYKQLLNTNFTELSNDKSLESNIKNIIYLSSVLNNKKKEYTLNKIKNYLEIASSNVTSQLSSLKNEKTISLGTSLDYTRELEENILKLLDDIKKLSDKVKPYQMLLSCLSENDSLNNNEINSDINQNTIVEDIKMIKYVLSKLSNSKYKNELENSINSLFDKYKKQIDKILNDEELLIKSDYEKLELELRKDINPILELINKYAYLDKYEEKTANKVNIHNQLLKSIDMISSGKIIKMDKDVSSEVITSFVIETYNEIISSEDITSEDKKMIITDLQSLLSNALNELKTNTIDSLEEYNEVTMSILKEIAGVKLSALEYIRKTIDYKKASK